MNLIEINKENINYTTKEIVKNTINKLNKNKNIKNRKKKKEINKIISNSLKKGENIQFDINILLQDIDEI